MKFNYDIVLCSVPKMDLLAPYVGPALLKALAQKNGFRAKCVDLNIELFRTVGSSYRGLWTEDSRAFYSPFFFKYETELFPNFIENWATKIVDLNSRYVGISCITYMDRLFGEMLLQKIKALNPNQLIVIGGTDVASRYADWFARGLIDFFIFGDAEPHILKLLKSDQNRGRIVDDAASEINLAKMPYPDYSDFPLSEYWTHSLAEELSKPVTSKLSAAYITASRGCVRSCSFCDIKHYWQKFNFRSGKATANEMIHQLQTLGINYFYFTDSLINGNRSELVTMANSLKEFNKSGPSTIQWRAQYIVRSMPSKLVQQEIQLLADAGCDLLIVGIESGSERLRGLMGKHFSNDDVLELARACNQYRVRLGLLFLIGYPDESVEDLNLSIKLVNEIREIGTALSYVSIGHTLHMLWDTPLLSATIENEVTLDFFGSWRSPGSTLSVRLERLKFFKNSMLELGQRIRDPRSDSLELELQSNESLNERINEPATRIFEKVWTQKMAASCSQHGKSENESDAQRSARLDRHILLEMILVRELRRRSINWARIPELECDVQEIDSAIESKVGGLNKLVLSVQSQLHGMKDSTVFKLLFYLRSPGAHRFFRSSNLMTDSVRRIYSLLDNAINEYRSAQLIDCYESNFGSWAKRALDTDEIESGIRLDNEMCNLKS